MLIESMLVLDKINDTNFETFKRILILLIV